MTLLPPTAPHPHLSPRQLQVASYLYGLDTPNLDTATVLELGCDQGQNLLAFAYSHPLAKAIGIDLDPETISLGQQQLTNKGISNIELHALDLAQLIQADLPLCDYIIVRGLFAQTDLDTRLQLLNHCRQFLSPNGVIVIQYAVYPGSKALDGVFDSLALHSAQSEAKPEQQIKALRAMLGFLGEGMSKDSASTQAIQAAISQLEQQNDQELYISVLGGLHHPCYFIEFASQLENAGLCYVGDADPASELPERIGTQAKSLVSLINPSKNKILTQQYLDTLTQKSYRYSLLSHHQHTESIEALPDTSKVADLHWAGYFQIKSNSHNTEEPVFETKSGHFLQTPHTISQHIFQALGDAWPYSLNVKALARQAAPIVDLLDDIDNPAAHQKVTKTLAQIFTYSSEHVFLSKESGPYNAFSHNSPPASPLTQLQYGETPNYINLWNEKTNVLTNSVINVSDDINSVDEIKKIDELNKQGLVFINYEGRQEIYAQAYKITCNHEDNTANHYLTKLLNFYFHAHFFENKKRIDYPYPVISNENVNFIKNNLQEDPSVFISKIEKKSLSDKEIAYAYYLYTDKKIDEKKLTSSELSIKSIELYPDNYYYYIYYIYTVLHINNYNLNSIYILYWISRKLFILNGTDSLLLSNIATIYKKNQKSNSSEKIYKKIKEQNPKNISNINSLALALSEQGKAEEALNEYEGILSSMSPIDYSNYLFIALHSTKYTPEKLFELHRNYGISVERWATQQNWKPKPFTKKPSNTPLRVGFVSGDLYNHAVTKFLLPYWEGLNTSRFHIYAYYTNNISDSITERLKEKATKWTDSYSLNYLDLAQVIRDDDIDILIDLSGHTGHNSLPAFALKPAPVQITWIGYPATTGLEAMDYIFANDFYYNNKDFTWQFTEKFLCLKSTSSIFDHGVNLPPRTDYIPVKINNHFTFASFNRPQKISNEVLETWAKIMIGCPGDKLLLANMPDDETITAFKEKMISFGTKESQLIFKKRCSLYDYLNLHNEVDLLLDTFPYAGGTTSVHAISMGLATIYLKGKTMASNPLIYNRYNLSDFGANNIKEYIEKAIYHSKDHERLQKLRENLKLKNNNGKRSPVELFEKSLIYAWENYCLGNPAQSIIIN